MARHSSDAPTQSTADTWNCKHTADERPLVVHLPVGFAGPRADTHSREEHGLLLRHKSSFLCQVLQGRTQQDSSQSAFSVYKSVIKAAIPIFQTGSHTIVSSAPHVLDYRKTRQNRHNTYQTLVKQSGNITVIRHKYNTAAQSATSQVRFCELNIISTHVSVEMTPCM
jgi:hypothetical protein